MSKWLLPEYVSDVLPSEARKIEEMRRFILDKFRTFGYELVMPPLLEYIDSLLTGTGQDLDIQTFKLLDIHTAKTMGIRADITPQIARIDAHLLGRQGITRLCYVGETLHTKPSNNQETRTPLQIGAEIYGTTHIQADIEVLQLMYQTLIVAGVSNFCISIGHAKFIEILEIDVNSELFSAILSKDISIINSSNHKYKQIILDLMQVKNLNQEYKLSLIKLSQKHQILSNIIEDIILVCDSLSAHLLSVQSVQQDIKEPIFSIENCIIDITDVEGYCYHTGLTYNVYHKNSHSPIAKGGRYDKVSSAFGRVRPATGFSVNLRQISPLSSLQSNPNAILAPWLLDNDLQILIGFLRNQGEVVIQLEDNIHIDEFKFTHKIVKNPSYIDSTFISTSDDNTSNKIPKWIVVIKD
jgi:ATP phosphoribosyltransferase regulatory subunit